MDQATDHKVHFRKIIRREFRSAKSIGEMGVVIAFSAPVLTLAMILAFITNVVLHIDRAIHHWVIAGRYRLMSPEQQRAFSIATNNEIIEEASKLRITGQGSHPDDYPLHRMNWEATMALEKMALKSREHLQDDKSGDI